MPAPERKWRTGGKEFGAHNEDEADREQARGQPSVGDDDIKPDCNNEQEKLQPRVPMVPAILDAGILVILDHPIETVGIELTAHMPLPSAGSQHRRPWN